MLFKPLRLHLAAPLLNFNSATAPNNNIIIIDLYLSILMSWLLKNLFFLIVVFYMPYKTSISHSLPYKIYNTFCYRIPN